MLHSLPRAYQPRADDQAVTFAQRQLAPDPPVLFFDQLLQLRLGAGREPTVGQFLNTVG